MPMFGGGFGGPPHHDLHYASPHRHEFRAADAFRHFDWRSDPGSRFETTPGFGVQPDRGEGQAAPPVTIIVVRPATEVVPNLNAINNPPLTPPAVTASLERPRERLPSVTSDSLRGIIAASTLAADVDVMTSSSHMSLSERFAGLLDPGPSSIRQGNRFLRLRRRSLDRRAIAGTTRLD
jgi:hypothetical protein